jgi:Domain of unknown function (DUF4189)
MLGRTRRIRVLSIASIAVLMLALAVPAFAAADWGAIAVNPRTGKIGVSYDYSTSHHAKKRALAQCHQSGCRVAVWVSSQYAALVLKRNGAFVAGVGLTRNLAFERAKERAHEHSAKRYAWVYSG